MIIGRRKEAFSELREMLKLHLCDKKNVRIFLTIVFIILIDFFQGLRIKNGWDTNEKWL